MSDYESTDVDILDPIFQIQEYEGIVYFQGQKRNMVFLSS